MGSKSLENTVFGLAAGQNIGSTPYPPFYAQKWQNAPKMSVVYFYP